MLPLELPLPIEPDELLPVLGELELGELDDDPEEPVELPLLPIEPELVPPLEELEPDLLKWASHSEREIWPSLLVSTDEKLGVERLLLSELELGELDELPPAAPVDELPLEDGEDELEPLVADGDEDDDEGLLDDEDPAATARPDTTKSAAAVVMVTRLSIWMTPLRVGEKPPSSRKRRAGYASSVRIFLTLLALAAALPARGQMFATQGMSEAQRADYRKLMLGYRDAFRALGRAKACGLGFDAGPFFREVDSRHGEGSEPALIARMSFASGERGVILSRELDPTPPKPIPCEVLQRGGAVRLPDVPRSLE